MLHQGNRTYAIDPRQLAEALASSMPEPEFDTRMLPDEVLRVYEKGDRRVVISYRKPQKTGIWLDGIDNALHVPMPGLAIARVTTDRFKRVSYSVVALKRRPQAGSKVYNAPLPNVGTNSVCWGTVPKPPISVLMGADLSEDWANFLGSHFGSHATSQKSEEYPKDIRQLLREMHT
ncbi:MAG: hypothetical protein AAFQ07_07515, partial [Chloroflexota bacterium]